MPMKIQTILATLIALPLVIATAADDAPVKQKRDPAQIFKTIDHDGDGTLSFEEYKASTIGHIDPSRVGDVFKKKDSDGNGKLTLVEFMYVPPREPTKPAATPAKKE